MYVCYVYALVLFIQYTVTFYCDSLGCKCTWILFNGQLVSFDDLPFLLVHLQEDLQHIEPLPFSCLVNENEVWTCSLGPLDGINVCLLSRVCLMDSTRWFSFFCFMAEAELGFQHCFFIQARQWERWSVLITCLCHKCMNIAGWLLD